MGREHLIRFSHPTPICQPLIAVNNGGHGNDEHIWEMHGWHREKGMLKLTVRFRNIYYLALATEATYLASEVERKLWPLPVDTCKYYGISLRVTDDPSCLTRPGVVFVTPDHLL